MNNLINRKACKEFTLQWAKDKRKGTEKRIDEPGKSSSLITVGV